MPKEEVVVKEHLISDIRQATGATKEVAIRVIDLFIEEVREHVIEDNKTLLLSNFGTFEARFKKERNGRNPRTKEPAVIKSRHRLTFTPSRNFRKTIV